MSVDAEGAWSCDDVCYMLMALRAWSWRQGNAHSSESQTTKAVGQLHRAIGEKARQAGLGWCAAPVAHDEAQQAYADLKECVWITQRCLECMSLDGQS